MPLDFQKARDRLQTFQFHDLFIEELGWSQPSSPAVERLEIEEQSYTRSRISEMSGVHVFEVTAADGEIPSGEMRSKIYKQIAESFAENLLIFVNGDRTRSLWYWAKREGTKVYPRTETYIKTQPADLLLSKIGGLKIELDELDEEGNISTFEVADRLQKSLDVEKVTKKFYQAFQLEHQEFLGYIQGIDQESDRRWYTSVILNRLMFVYFLQKKGFIDKGNTDYLRKKLAESQKRGTDRFYHEFLHTLFFEGLAKPERDRPPVAKKMLGQVCYLNGGLFLKHPIELNDRYTITITDAAFERIFTLFDRYSWHLDDRPAGKPDEINPDVLGYIFEKYINQKAFGAYYTRPEITEYLCDRTINKLVLDRVNGAMAKRSRDPREIQEFESIDDMVMHMDIEVCRHLIMGTDANGEDAILRNLSLLDPACGSGAFLIAAMKTLIRIYERVIGVVQLSTDHQLRGWLDEVMHDHPSLPYFIKKRIITDNLYGVDIMEEAVEIAKLRLFLALVSSARKVDELEPLPNIDFNIMAGNSLIGLIRVDEASFDAVGDSEFQQGNLLQLEAANNYRAILEEKNRSIELYKKHSFQRQDEGGTDQEDRLQMLRDHIDQVNRESEAKLNQLLLNEFTQRLGIKFEQAQLNGKSKKRNLTIQDIEALKPFHWGYHFDKVIEERGGFDAIIANPPWEIFKPIEKEFCQRYDSSIDRRTTDLEELKKKLKELIKDSNIKQEYLEYLSRFPYLNIYYRTSQQYKNQISIINGKKAKSDINLYKLFLEQCFNLLRSKGECGIVLPSGIYSDQGTTQLRKLLFEETQITGLFCIENRNSIFEGVDSRFKFVILSFMKGGRTDDFPAAFMQQKLDLLQNFPSSENILIDVQMIQNLSPDTLSVIEFKTQEELRIAEKIAKFPLLGERLNNRWNIVLGREFHMTDDRDIFLSHETNLHAHPLFEGKMLHHFNHQASEPRYWIEEQEGRLRILKKQVDLGQLLDYEKYRFAYRSITSNTNQRTMICSLLPQQVFAGNSLNVNKSSAGGIANNELLFFNAIMSSFTLDFILRQRVATQLNIFYIYQLPIPRFTDGDPYFSGIVERAAKLICTTPQFDNLAAEVGLGSHVNGVIDEAERAQLRAELDGIIAHLYGLTEAEFTHILSTFPIVSDETKQAALEEYRKLAPLVGDQDILNLIAQGESAHLEFKSTARWDLKEDKKNPVMEDVILKTVAAFLNSNGGTLLIGVADDGSIVGLQPDYQTLQKKDRDGFELWLMGDLLLKAFGNDLAPHIAIHIGIIDTQEVCKVTLQPAPHPVYCDIRNKNGQPEESFFIRAGNQTKRLTKPSEIASYTQTRWPT